VGMNKLDIFLFLAGIISVAIVVLAFFVPVFLLMIYKSVEETRSLMKELLQEVRMMNYLKSEEEEEHITSPKVNPEKREELSELCKMFLELDSEKPDVELVVIDEEDERPKKRGPGK
jgi:hypothetical protein